MQVAKELAEQAVEVDLREASKPARSYKAALGVEGLDLALAPDPAFCSSYTSREAKEVVLGYADLLELLLPCGKPNRALPSLAPVYHLCSVQRIPRLEVPSVVRDQVFAIGLGVVVHS